MHRAALVAGFVSMTLLPLLLAAQASRPASRATGDAETGEAVFQQHCSMCHSTAEGVKIVGPSLHSVTKGPHGQTLRSVRTIVTQGKGTMPPMGAQLSAQEMNDLLAYVRKL